VWIREAPLRREQLRDGLSRVMPASAAPRLDAGVLKCGNAVFVMIDPQKEIGASVRAPLHLRAVVHNQQGAGADHAVLIEGSLSDSYFTARDCLYSQYSVV
jgi:hypothetical protein